MEKGIRMALALGSFLIVWVSALTNSAALSAATVHPFHFRLESTQVVPAVNSNGTGWCTVTLDDVTGSVAVTGEYACLNGTVTVAHIHGPAARGQNAGAILPLTLSGGVSGMVTASGTLTAQEVLGPDSRGYRHSRALGKAPLIHLYPAAGEGDLRGAGVTGVAPRSCDAECRP